MSDPTDFLHTLATTIIQSTIHNPTDFVHTLAATIIQSMTATLPFDIKISRFIKISKYLDWTIVIKVASLMILPLVRLQGAAANGL